MNKAFKIALLVPSLILVAGLSWPSSSDKDEKNSYRYYTYEDEIEEKYNNRIKNTLIAIGVLGGTLVALFGWGARAGDQKPNELENSKEEVNQQDNADRIEKQRKSKWFVVNLLRIFAVLQLFSSVIASVTEIRNIGGTIAFLIFGIGINIALLFYLGSVLFQTIFSINDNLKDIVDNIYPRKLTISNEKDGEDSIDGESIVYNQDEIDVSQLYESDEINISKSNTNWPI